MGGFPNPTLPTAKICPISTVNSANWSHPGLDAETTFQKRNEKGGKVIHEPLRSSNLELVAPL